MKTYLLKKNNKAYSLNELADKEIKANTEIKYEEAENWTTANELPELQEMIALNASYNKVRPSLKKREPVFLVGIILFPILQMFIPVEGLQIDESSSVLSEPKIYAHITLAIIIVIGFFHHVLTRRYYRLIKVITKNKQKTKTTYQIQTCLSFQRNSKTLNEKKLKWNSKKSVDTFPSNKKSNAKNAFDELTIPKQITEQVVKSPKERNTSPTILEIVLQEFSYIKKHNTKLSHVFAFVFIISISGFLLLICFSKVDQLSDVEKEAVFTPIFHNVLMVIGVLLAVFLIFKYIPIPILRCYVRLIKRTEGTVNDRYSYHEIQYLITRKKVNEATASNNAKWRNIAFRVYRSINSNTVNKSSRIRSEKELSKIFHKITEQIVSVTHAAVD